MRINRRTFLKATGASASVALVGYSAYEALALSGNLPAWLRGPVSPATRDQIWHTLNRITFGPRSGQVDAVAVMGLHSYLEQQLDPFSLNDDAAAKHFGNFITLDMSSAELLGTKVDGQVMVDELDTSTILHAVYSERQLYEVMVNFWSEHFSIFHYKGNSYALKTVDDREVIRKYALSSFSQLLNASAKSPAMLDYLDNVVSDKDHPNENYARELMELHTLGVGNYTEKDVKEVARCFTGWTLRYDSSGRNGTFAFVSDMHDNESKTVLGHTIPAQGGMKDGQLVLDILARHPATAHHLSLKLCRRFIGDNPPDAIVKEVAQKFIDSKGALPDVLRVIFASPAFLHAPPKFKRPYEYVLSLYRALDVQVSTAEPLDALSRLEQMNHRPFKHASPDGYSDLATRWQSDLLSRWNTGIETVYSSAYGTHVDVLKLARLQGAKNKADDIVNYYAKHLLGRTLTKEESTTLLKYVSSTGKPSIDLASDDGPSLLIDVIALLIASPAYQYR